MHDLLIPIVFYIFASIAVLSALAVVTQNNPVRCVLSLVVTFFACSVLWILVNAEFLALILILVYVGAVMTLFLFIVMMLDIDTESLKVHFLRYMPFGLILVALLVGLLLISIPVDWSSINIINTSHEIANSQLPEAQNLTNTEQIGMLLFTQYAYAFELAAAVLLVAIIAAITLAHRAARRSKSQDVLKQLMVRRQDRVQLISMKSQK